MEHVLRKSFPVEFTSPFKEHVRLILLSVCVWSAGEGLRNSDTTCAKTDRLKCVSERLTAETSSILSRGSPSLPISLAQTETERERERETGKQTDPALKEIRIIPLRMCQVTRKQCAPDTEDRYFEVVSSDRKKSVFLRAKDHAMAQAWYNAIQTGSAALSEQRPSRAEKHIAASLESYTWAGSLSRAQSGRSWQC
ncbi:hypothetical protein QQF64_031765 [Cirrhinus molitorella]|uniref:PH domain-containing protein n=1 Tax=Cirrhinus molitorella TaxID=172907 RepID=A0ABR3MY20_9TELE